MMPVVSIVLQVTDALLTLIAHLPVSPRVDGPLRSAVENVTGAHIPTLIMLGATERGKSF